MPYRSPQVNLVMKNVNVNLLELLKKEPVAVNLISKYSLALIIKGKFELLLLIPIFIPLLIFATSAIESASMLLPYHQQLATIASLLLISVALSPMAVAYSLRVSQN